MGARTPDGAPALLLAGPEARTSPRSMGHRSVVGPQPIADPGLRQDVARLLRVGLQLLA